MSADTGPVVALPASFGQERLWFFDQLAPGSPLYNVHFGLRLRGPVDPAALGAALNIVVERHESLRTVLRAVDGQPRQVIAERLTVPTGVHDLSEVPTSDRAAEAARRAGEHARASFELSTGPLLRSDVLRFADDDHAWLLTLHHAVCDGWSAALLFAEISEAYTAAVHRRDPQLPDLALQYADFALWQRDVLASGGLDGELSYWRTQLAGAAPLLELPTDHPRPPTQRFQGGLVEAVVEAGVTSTVRELARQERVTLFATLLSAFAVTLHRYAGTDDVLVGTAVGGRNQVELEPLIGFFANTVPLRMDLAGEPSFRELLGRVRQVVIDAQSHADLPFEHLVQALRPDREPSYHPIFQVMFDVQPGGGEALRLPGVEASPIQVLDRRISLFDFSISVVEEPKELRLVAEYDSDLFTEATAQRLLAAYQAVLAAGVVDPDRKVGSLPLLTSAERARSLAAADRRALAAPPATLHELIIDVARRRPQAPALHDAASDRVYDYRTLDEWSAAVAGRLRAAGVGRGDVVALLARRSPAAIAGLLGVLRAGAAYLPLDADTPPGRWADLLADARPAALLADPVLSGQLTAGGYPVLDLDPTPPPDAAELAAEFAAVDAGPPVDPDELAYVMYTSGSTGRPKGVLVPHRGVVNYAIADRAVYRLTGDDRVLQFTSLAFDVSAEEIFPCLTVGACLVLRSEDMLETPQDFFADCARLGVTVMHLPTAYFHELAAECDRTGLRPPAELRVMAIGGEATSVARIAAWRAIAPTMHLSNAYGPTETSIATTLGRLAGPEAAAELEHVPLGEPLAGTAVYVLDQELEPVPAGMIGAVYIGGAGLARGYLHRPDLSADRFVPDPFGSGERLYRTGDLARLLPDGQLEFCGRTDAQVKVRGYRIEPGEVEAALTRLAEVRHAVVVPRPTGRGDHELVAYVEPAAPHDEGLARRLREQLAGHLPAWLIPASWMIMPALPRTGTDKIDRNALPVPDRGASSDPVDTGTRRALTTEAERTVAEVWREVLDVEQVGPDDDFFALGGHSLLATRVVARLRRHYGSAVRLRQVFEHPQLSSFAAALTAASSTADAAGARSGPLTGLRRASGAELLAGLTAGLSTTASSGSGLSRADIDKLLQQMDGGSTAGRREVTDRHQEP